MITIAWWKLIMLLVLVDLLLDTVILSVRSAVMRRRFRNPISIGLEEFDPEDHEDEILP